MAKLIGNKPNQVPVNADLGSMAYQDSDSVAAKSIVADVIKSPMYQENYLSLLAGGSVDCTAANVFFYSLSANVTFTFNNPPPSGTAYGFTLELKSFGSYTVTWPASVQWAGGIAPIPPSSGQTDIYTFYTRNGGSTWYGFVAGDNMQ